MKNVPRLLTTAKKLDTNNFISQIATMENVFAPEECNHIISMAEALPGVEGVVETQKESKNVEYKTSSARKSNIRFLAPDNNTSWIFDKLDACLNHVNQAYQFKLLGFYEGAQIASYEGQQYYDWHMDLGQETTSSRKLSVSVQLSSPEEYSGGNLEFMCTEATVPRSQGSVIVFPSYLVHRVAPVTSGVRWSMVSWIHGSPFR